MSFDHGGTLRIFFLPSPGDFTFQIDPSRGFTYSLLISHVLFPKAAFSIINLWIEMY